MASSIKWVWSIGIFVIVILSSEINGQKQDPSTVSFQDTIIFSTKQMICRDAALKSANYDCFKGRDNVCKLPNETFEFYIKRPEKQEIYKKRVTKMCTDQQFNSDIMEFAKCMNQQTSEWRDCRTNELRLQAETLEKLKNQKPINDIMCDPQWDVVLTCYQTVGNKKCSQTSETVFETIITGDKDGLCISAAEKLSNTLFIGLIAVFISIWSSFRFN